MRIVSRPTCGASFRFTASVGDQAHAPPRHAPVVAGPHTMAMIRWLWPTSSARCLPGLGLFVQCRLQPFLLIAPGNGSHRFRSHAQHWPPPAPPSAHWSSWRRIEARRKHSRRFPSLRQHRGKLLPILPLQLNMHTMVALHVPTMRPFARQESDQKGTYLYGHRPSVVNL